MVNTNQTAIAGFAAGVDRTALAPWPKPPLGTDRTAGPLAFLALHDFKKHMTDESWQIQIGLEAAGFRLFGKGFADNQTDARRILQDFQPKTAIIADPREWEPSRPGCFDKTAAFTGLATLRETSDVFRVTIVKDMWYDNKWSHNAHAQLEPHLYLHYYRWDMVQRFRPWIRPEQALRIWHPIDRSAVPEVDYAAKRDAPVLSGALSEAIYPLRTRLANAAGQDKFEATVLTHPGYNNAGSRSTAYFQTLARHKVAFARPAFLDARCGR